MTANLFGDETMKQASKQFQINLTDIGLLGQDEKLNETILTYKFSKDSDNKISLFAKKDDSWVELFNSSDETLLDQEKAIGLFV